MKLGVKDELCSGCKICQTICSLTLFDVCNPKRSALKIVGHFPAPGRYEVVTCDQCGDCAEVCPVEAIKLENGVYKIDRDECTGCGACVDACPKGAMILWRGDDVPIKCTLCGACMEFCPRGALYDADKPSEQAGVA
ncbi:MAG TPA: 4Fe-4S dicluster domain-containing protein [Clostridia bacterium]|nr:4Fe-4S dicluster domain-containing protein [Clostridia bacterium]